MTKTVTSANRWRRSTTSGADEMFEPGAVDPAVDLLAELAGGGRALELGIGTGRIALPLAARGVPVHGIELSRAMVARLRAKPGGEAIGVTIGDFSTTRVDGTFSVAYLVFNTIMNLTTQAAQVACFRNVAAHLEPGGCFVIEVGVPGPAAAAARRAVRRLRRERETHWGIDEYDVANQGLISHHFEVARRPGREVVRAVPLRLAGRAGPDGRARRACGCASAGRAGIGSRSPARAGSTCRSGGGADQTP